MLANRANSQAFIQQNNQSFPFQEQNIKATGMETSAVSQGAKSSAFRTFGNVFLPADYQH